MNRQEILKWLTGQREQIDIALAALSKMSTSEAGTRQVITAATTGIATVPSHHSAHASRRTTPRKPAAKATPQSTQVAV